MEELENLEISKPYADVLRAKSEDEKQAFSDAIAEMYLTREERAAQNKKGYFVKKVSDWNEVKSHYIKGVWSEPLSKIIYPTLQDLADVYGISVGTIWNKSKDGNWNKLRTLFRAKIREKREAAELRAIISESAQYDASALELIKKLLVVAHLKMTPYQQYYGDALDLDEVEVDEVPETLSIKDLRDLTGTAKELVALTRTIIGEDETSSIHEEIKNIRLESQKETGSDEKVSELEKQLREIKSVRATIKGKLDRGAS